MLDRRTFVIAGTGALFASPALAQNADDPAAPVTAIYERASGGGKGGTFVWRKKADRARWFSRDLAALWTKAEGKTAKGDQAPVGFDPISNSQDPMIRAPRIAVKRRDANSALVAVSFVGWGETPTRMTVLYDMVREATAFRARHWAIDDIRGTIDGKDWSLKALLRNWKG